MAAVYGDEVTSDVSDGADDLRETRSVKVDGYREAKCEADGSGKREEKGTEVAKTVQ